VRDRLDAVKHLVLRRIDAFGSALLGELVVFAQEMTRRR
jgi:hypothetical protein